MSLDVDAVRQSLDRIAASQEQMTRNVDQLARPGADDARDHQTAGDRSVHPLQELRASATAGVGPVCHNAVVAGADGALMARIGESLLVPLHF
jgi:hypothetical protein